MPAHLIYGDSFLVSRELRRLEEEAVGESLLESNRHRLAGNQVRLPDLLSVCNALPFMDTVRLVLVEGLLTAFEPRTGRGRSRSGASGRAARGLGDWEGLAPAIPAMPPTSLLLFVDGPLSENNPLLRQLRPQAQVHNLTAPSREALALWIKNQAQEKGVGITPAALRSIVDLVGNDLWTLDREMEKLSLFAAGRQIEEEDVTQMVAQVREASIFNAVDAIIDGKPGPAMRLLRQLIQDGRDASYIIGMVGRQLRLLALARDLTDRRVPSTEMGSRMGVNSPFALRKTLEQARRHSREDIAWQYRRLLEADLAIKRGKLEEDMSLEMLVADLAGRTRR